MPKDFTAPSQNWNVQDQLDQSKQINQENNNTLDLYKKKTENIKFIQSSLDELENNGQDVSSLRKKLDEKLSNSDLGFGEKLGAVGRNLGNDYASSFSKAFGGNLEKSYSDKLDEAKQKREEVIKPVSTIAMEVALDPLTYTPLNFASKGTKAVRMAKDFGKGAGLSAGLYTAKEYGDDNYKATDSAIAGAFGGGLNALLGRVLNRKVAGDLTNPDVTSGENITNKILFEQKKLNPDVVAAPTQPIGDEVVQENIIKPNNNSDDIAAKINKANFGDTNTVQPEVQAKSDIPKVDNLTMSNSIDNTVLNPSSKLPDALPTNPEEFKQVMQYAKDNNAVDEFISKLPPNARVDEVKQVFDKMPVSQQKENPVQLYERLKNDYETSTSEKIQLKQDAEDFISNSINSQEINKANNGILQSNGTQTFGGASVGGLESEFNQRDYNNDGKHDYKDNIYGVIVGALGINAAKKLFPKAFKDGNIDKNTNGMFVGARPDEQGAFSDIATKKVMREIDDSKSTISRKGFNELFLKDKSSVGNVLEHNELFNKYPKMKEMPIYTTNGETSFDGHIMLIDRKYLEPKNKDALKSVILHELQHSVQNNEGWARGGTPENFVKPKDFGTPAENINKIQEMWDARQIHEMYGDKWESEFKSIFGRDLKDYEKYSIFLKEEDLSRIYKEWKRAENPYQAYQNLFGEQQARATQQRMNMTPEQRASEDWTQTLAKNEGKYNEPIIKYDNGVSMSISKDADKIKRDENFKKWFNGSKVLDKNGEPLVVYHGAKSDFNTFDSSKSDKAVKLNALGKGYYFTTKPERASSYAKEVDGSNIMPVYLNAKNVLDTDSLNIIPKEVVNRVIGLDKAIPESRILDTLRDYGIKRSEYNNVLSKMGYDGIKNNNTYVVFNPTQIKSIHNKGTFDGNNPNVLMASPTISGGLVGGVTGATSDLDGDGKITYKDIAFGALGGAGLTKGALLARNTNIVDKAKSIIKNISDTETADKIFGHKIYQKTDYMNLREAMIVGKNKQMESFALLHEQLKLLDDTTRTKMYNYMSGDRSIQLDTNIKQLADNYTNEIDRMGKELVDLGVLEEAQFDKFKGRYLHRRYEKDLSQKFNSLFTKGKTVQGVYARGNEWTGTKTEYEDLFNDGKIGDFFQGKIEATRMNNGQYKFRQDWTDEQRARWGEIKDIAFSLPETLMRTREMIDHAKMLKNIVDNTGYVSNDALEGYVQLSGKRYGALNGKYVPSDIASDIKEFGDALFGSDGKLLSSKGMEAFKALSTFWKKSHTVYNPIAHLNNLLSNVTMQFGAGINPNKAVINATKGAMASQKVNQFRELTAKKIIGLTAEENAALRALSQDEDLKLWNQAQQAGLFGRSNLNDILNKYINPTNAQVSSNKFKNAFQKVDEATSSWYQGEDNIMRFSMLKSLTESGISFDDAIKQINNTIPDYTKPMSQWARFGRDSMLTPFISWTYYATPIILKQMKDKPERIATIYGALYGMNQLMGIDPFNEKDIPQQNFSMKRIPIYKNGNEVTTIKVDRWIPHNDILNPLDFIKNLTSCNTFTFWW